MDKLLHLKTMDKLLHLKFVKAVAAVSAAVAGVTTYSYLAGWWTSPTIDATVVGEVLRNCGVWFAIPMISSAVFGAVYALCVWHLLPDCRQIRSGADKVLQALASPERQARGAPQAQTGSPTAPSHADTAGQQPVAAAADPSRGGQVASPSHADTAGPQPVAAAADPSRGGQVADGPVAPGAAAPADRPGAAPPAPAPSVAGSAGRDSAVPAELQRLRKTLLAGGPPSLANRLAAVLPTLIAQGPEAARETNRIVTEGDESDMAVALIPSQICEWVLPLLGFLGTVWGLHRAIGPLSTGVDTMMRAMAPGGTDPMREEAMRSFTEGFGRLRIAFDTTLVGLLGVVLVGFLLFLARGRAVRALGAIQWATEEILRTFPMPSSRSMLQELIEVLQQGLLTEKDGQPQSRLGVLQQTIQQGLAVVPGGRGGAAIPWFEHVVDSVRSHVVGAMNVMVRLGTWQLIENRKQTHLQADYVVPYLRAIHRHALPEEGIMDEVLTWLRFERIAEVEETLEVHALAVTNRSSAVAIGGYNRNAGRRFLHEHRVDRLGRALKVEFKPIFTGPRDPLPRQDSEETQAREPTGDVLGLTYSPDSNYLYLLCIDGLVRRFSEQDMQEYGPLAGVFDHDPFVWFPGRERAPLVGMWRRRPGSQGYELAPLTEDGSSPSLAPSVQQFLDSFERVRNQRDVQLRVRTDGRWLCLAGRNGEQQRLVVCKRNGSPLWEEAGRLFADAPITSFDVCERTGSVLFAKSGEGIFQWIVGENGQPACIASVRGPRAVSHLFLNSDGTVLVAVFGSEVVAFALSDPQRPRTFDTYGGHVTHAVQSLDRNSIAIATENNLLWLLNLRDPL